MARSIDDGGIDSALSRREIVEDVAKLLKFGEVIFLREVFENSTPEKRKEYARVLTKSKADESAEAAAATTTKGEQKDLDPKAKEFIADITRKSNFATDYQSWYSRSLRVVQQVLPDRYEEFRSYYQQVRRKEIVVTTYGIADYIAGIRITRGFDSTPEFDHQQVAMQNFATQRAILKSAQDLLDSHITSLEVTIQASILDSELDSATTLLKASHVRSAGVVAGVVLEAHLQRVLATHSIRIRKKPTLSVLNDSLKEAGVIDVPTWRKLQYLGDVRNMCAHKSDRDPAHDEVADLIQQVDKIIHTVN